MVFSTMLFLWVFLPFVIIGNTLIGRLGISDEAKVRTRNIFLLIASLIFYAWGGPRYLLLMLSVILINYFCARLITGYEAYSKIILAAGLAADILILVYFKYLNLIVHTMEKLSGHELSGFRDIVLPIGISFYIFQSMSYTIDVYRKEAVCRKNILDFALYVSLFCQLIAGPIVQYRDIKDQLVKREVSRMRFSDGINRFVYGLAKKVLLANVFGETVDAIWDMGSDNIGTMLSVGAAVLYSLQIYYDFSGYSDMAIGLAKMLGFELKENFDHPYMALTVSSFWRRWHISLSSWFKNYVYIPLGGNRRGLARTCVNIFMVFLLTGIWHGANYTFFFWGIYYALFLIAERIVKSVWRKSGSDIKPGIAAKTAGHIYTLAVVIVGWVFFRADSIGDALRFLRAFFRPETSSETVLEFMTLKLCVAAAAGILLCGPLQKMFSGFCEKKSDKGWYMLGRIAAVAALSALSILSLAGDTYNPFIYYQF